MTFAETFAFISPGLRNLSRLSPPASLGVLRTFAPISPDRLVFKSQVKDSFRACFPRPLSAFSELSRLFPPIRLVFKSQVKDGFRACFPRPFAPLSGLSRLFSPVQLVFKSR